MTSPLDTVVQDDDNDHPGNRTGDQSAENAATEGWFIGSCDFCQAREVDVCVTGVWCGIAVVACKKCVGVLP